MLCRPSLPLFVALGGPLGVVGGEVVALLVGQEGNRDNWDSNTIQLLYDRGPLQAEVGEHEGDVGPELPEILDDRGVGEQGREALVVELAGERQAGLS